MNHNYKIIFFLIMLIACGIEAKLSVGLAPIGGKSVLHEAIAENDLKKIKKGLDKGISVNARNNAFATPLHDAVYVGAYDSIKLLLENKANVNAQNWYGYTPLHIILKNIVSLSKHMQYKIAVLLFEYGADLRIRDYSGHTPLYRAAQDVNNHQFLTLLLNKGVCFGDVKNNILLDAVTSYYETNDESVLDFIALLVQRGYKIDDLFYAPINFNSLLNDRRCREVFQTLCNHDAFDLNLINRMGFSLLHLAVMDESYEVVEFLLKNGARGDIKHRDGLTPLYYAATEQMYNFLRTFSQISVTDDNDTFDKVIAYKNKSEVKMDEKGQTLLHHAVIADDWHEVERLIKLGANVNKHDFKDGYTPLHYAAYRGSVSLCQLLIKSGADINSKNNRGLTPLHLLPMHFISNREGISLPECSMEWWLLGDVYETCELLITAGANIDVKDYEGSTPLHYAARWNETKIAELLIAAGADVHAQDYEGFTPLHNAACSSSLCKLLIEAGADIHSKSYCGLSPLYFALFAKSYIYGSLWYENIDTVRLLLHLGADINSKEMHGFPLLHCAVNADFFDRIEFLLKHGANSSLIDLHGKTALDYAKSKEVKKLFSQIKKSQK